MGKENQLFAGAGKAVINIDSSCLPADGFTAVHDELHIRALVLKSNITAVIVSVELTSMFEETQALMMQKICQICGVEPENVWLTLTHSFAGPHIWPQPKPGEADIPRPGHKARTPEEIARNATLQVKYLEALEKACTDAVSSLQSAKLGFSLGECAVAASRNILTPEGWWMGTDSDEPCDKRLSLVRIDGSRGEPIAAMFVYGVRSCVASRIAGSDGGMQVSSDLCGSACNYLEKEFGGEFTALFLCGPAGDQEPQLKGDYDELDKNGALRHVNLGEAAFALLDAQGARLGADALKLWRNAGELSCDVQLKMGSDECVCATKRMNRDLRSQKPAHSFEFEPDGEKTLTAYALIIGGFTLVGLQPEMNGVTVCEIRKQLEGENVAVAIMVNGGDKCMPHAEAYENFKYQSQNSPFMPNQAEKLRDTAVGLVKRLKEKVDK